MFAHDLPVCSYNWFIVGKFVSAFRRRTSFIDALFLCWVQCIAVPQEVCLAVAIMCRFVNSVKTKNYNSTVYYEHYCMKMSVQSLIISTFLPLIP